VIIEINTEEKIEFKVNGMVMVFDPYVDNKYGSGICFGKTTIYSKPPSENVLERKNIKSMYWGDFCMIYKDFIKNRDYNKSNPINVLEGLKIRVAEFFKPGVLS
jgi:hypothetical protein